MNVRQFRLEDLDRVVEIWRSSGISVGLSDTREEVEKKVERDPDLFLVAEAGGNVVGSVMGAWDGRRAWVYHLAVDPGWRRRGTGRAMMGELERRVRARGARRMSLLVRKDNVGAIGFYEAMGFETTVDLLYARKTLGEDGGA